MDDDAVSGTNYEEQHDLLLTDVRRSVRYHMRRRRYYEGRHRLVSSISTVSGSAIVAVLWTNAPVPSYVPIFIAVLVTVISVWDLASQTVSMARLHSDLSRKFIELEQKLMVINPYLGTGSYDITPSVFNMPSAQAERLMIESDEPPIYRLLDVICHNETIDAYGRNRSDIYHIPWPKRVTANFIHWNTEKLKTLDQVAARRMDVKGMSKLH